MKLANRLEDQQRAAGYNGQSVAAVPISRYDLESFACNTLPRGVQKLSVVEAESLEQAPLEEADQNRCMRAAQTFFSPTQRHANMSHRSFFRQCLNEITAV